MADKKGIRAGEKLVAINSHPIRDILDYQFYASEKSVEIELDTRVITVKKGEYDDLGLEFETYLMDKQMSCTNKCIFCFIDQNPHGMRESIYFKDDDTRLAFFFGNYVTLTNVPDEELQRLVSMRISPVNVSVQATNPELRKMMLSNRFADKILDQMQILADGGIDLNAQIVLCKGINDGAELDRTLGDLERFIPRLKSISVVPVGLTKHRNGLYPLEAFSAEECSDVIDQVESIADKFLEKYGSRIVFASDEFYIRSGRALPSYEYYEGFYQLENGVGMLTTLIDEAESEMDFATDECPRDTKRTVSIATGAASYETISNLVEKIKDVWYNINCNIYPIKNNFYGESVTVSGLLTGGDIIDRLKGEELGEVLIIPGTAVRREGDLFLDNISIKDMERELGVKVVPSNGGDDLVQAILFTRE